MFIFTLDVHQAKTLGELLCISGNSSVFELELVPLADGRESC